MREVPLSISAAKSMNWYSLANQSILIRNLKNKRKPEDLLTEDEVELLTSPLDLAAYKNAITEAMFKGTKRNVESEKENIAPKNTQVE